MSHTRISSRMPSSGIEPETRGFSVLCSTNWANWANKLRGQDLNLWPSGYEPDELPDCSTPRYINIKMGRGGFEPPKQFAADLQSVPFGHSGICPFTQFNTICFDCLNCKADDRTRTDNLLITNQLLCQLSHIGIFPQPHLLWNGTYRARTYDLRVMSPTSFQTAPPRVMK